MSEKTAETLLSDHKNQQIISGSEPIFIDQGNAAFLFLHGFSGSPYEGREFAAYFAEKGYAVWVPLLPAHGTDPAEMEQIHYREWLIAVEEYYAAISEKYDQVIVCGQSMGGALALHLAANYPMAGVISLAGAIFIRDRRVKYLQVLRWLKPYHLKLTGPDIRDPQAKANSAAYDRYPTKSIIQLIRMIRKIKAELPKITCPCLLIHSRQDHTILYESMAYIAGRVSSKIVDTLTLEESYHVISVDQERAKIFQKIDSFLTSIDFPKSIRNA